MRGYLIAHRGITFIVCVSRLSSQWNCTVQKGGDHVFCSSWIPLALSVAGMHLVWAVGGSREFLSAQRLSYTKYVAQNQARLFGPVGSLVPNYVRFWNEKGEENTIEKETHFFNEVSRGNWSRWLFFPFVAETANYLPKSLFSPSTQLELIFRLPLQCGVARWLNYCE